MALAVVAVVIAALWAGPAHAASTFVVNSTSDAADADTTDGVCETATPDECTLRAAIEQANANGNPTETDTIEFDIPANQCVTPTDVCTITPATQLPTVTQAVTIDGYSQTGASPNTLANGTGPNPDPVGSDAQIKIELSGGPTTVLNGLLIQGTDATPVPNVTVKGLAINRFDDDGIEIEDTTDIRIEGNHIGTDASGTQNLGNRFGLFIQDTTNIVVGGDSPAARNVIAGTAIDGVLTSTTRNMTIQNNYVGTDASGTQDFGSGDDNIDINGDSGSVVGGDSPAARNVVFGAGDAGMEIFQVITDMLIIGNSVSQNSQGVDLTTSTVKGVSILNNSIFDNAQLGIDIQATSSGTNGRVNLNDEDDPDTGANNGQNYPVLTSATNVGGATDAAVVEGSLNSNPSTTFTVQFFSSPTADPSGFGEGEIYEGQTEVTTDANGDVTFSAPTDSPVPEGRVITSTATNTTTGDTSEFSKADVQSTGDIADVSVEKDAPARVDDEDEFEYTLTVTNDGPDAAEDVTVSDPLPKGVKFVAEGTDGRCSYDPSTKTVSCALGVLADGETEEVVIRAKAKKPGKKKNTATVESQTADPDGGNDSDRATTQANAAPIAVNDRYVMNEGRSISVNKPGILVNDRDPDGKKLEAVLVSKPKHGEVRLEKNGSFTYKPDRDYDGTDSFEYEACDGRGACSRKAEVTMTVRPVGG